MRYALLLTICLTPWASAEEFTVKFSAPIYFLPAVRQVVFAVEGSTPPGTRPHKSLAEATSVNGEVRLKSADPVDVWLVPKDGLPIKAIAGLKPKDQPNIKWSDFVGVIRVKGADLPRGKLLVTDPLDRGPEEKMHASFQWASDSRSEMLVLPRDYAIWIQPDNGSRARRVADKVRVLAGKTVDVD